MAQAAAIADKAGQLSANVFAEEQPEPDLIAGVDWRVRLDEGAKEQQEQEQQTEVAKAEGGTTQGLFKAAGAVALGTNRRERASQDDNAPQEQEAKVSSTEGLMKATVAVAIATNLQAPGQQAEVLERGEAAHAQLQALQKQNAELVVRLRELDPSLAALEKLHAELQELKLGALSKRAAAAGVPVYLTEQALDSDEPREALIQLLLVASDREAALGRGATASRPQQYAAAGYADQQQRQRQQTESLQLQQQLTAAFASSPPARRPRTPTECVLSTHVALSCLTICSLHISLSCQPLTAALHTGALGAC